MAFYENIFKAVMRRRWYWF